MPILKMGEISILVLRGNSTEMGYEHGYLFRDIIQEAIELYVSKSEEIYELPASILLSEAQRCLPFIPREYLKEMAAIAEGSGVHFNQLLALNCLSDVDGCIGQNILHCCNFVLSSPATRDGLFLHGRNLDFPTAQGWLQKASIIISRVPASLDAIPTLTVGFAGFVGMFTGYNQSSISCAEVGVPDPRPSIEGMPLPMMMRYALERSESIDDFFTVVQRTPRTCGYNLALGDGKRGKCACIELTRDLCEIRYPRKGVLVVDDVCFCKTTGHMRLTYPAGTFRYSRMMQLISENYGTITIGKALEFLADDYDMARAKRSGKSYNCICNHHTIQSVLFLPAENKLYVAMGTIPAPTGAYVEIATHNLWEC